MAQLHPFAPLPRKSAPGPRQIGGGYRAATASHRPRSELRRSTRQLRVRLEGAGKCGTGGPVLGSSRAARTEFCRSPFESRFVVARHGKLRTRVARVRVAMEDQKQSASRV